MGRKVTTVGQSWYFQTSNSMYYNRIHLENHTRTIKSIFCRSDFQQVFWRTRWAPAQWMETSSGERSGYAPWVGLGMSEPSPPGTRTEAKEKGPAKESKTRLSTSDLWHTGEKKILTRSDYPRLQDWVRLAVYTEIQHVFVGTVSRLSRVPGQSVGLAAGSVCCCIGIHSLKPAHTQQSPEGREHPASTRQSIRRMC